MALIRDFGRSGWCGGAGLSAIQLIRNREPLSASGVGVVRLIVLKSVLLLSSGSSNPVLFHWLWLMLPTENKSSSRWGVFYLGRFLWSRFSGFVWVPSGVVALSLGRPTTTARFRGLRENFKEVTFSGGGGAWRWLSHSLSRHTTAQPSSESLPKSDERKHMDRCQQSLSLSVRHRGHESPRESFNLHLIKCVSFLHKNANHICLYVKQWCNRPVRRCFSLRCYTWQWVQPTGLFCTTAEQVSAL